MDAFLVFFNMASIKEQKFQIESLICNRKGILSVSIEVHKHILLDSLEYTVDI